MAAPAAAQAPARAAAAPQAVTPQPKRAREESFPTTPEEWIRKVRKTGSTELEKERSNAVLSWVTEMLEHVAKYPADELLCEKMKKPWRRTRQGGESTGQHDGLDVSHHAPCCPGAHRVRGVGRELRPDL